MSLIYFLFVVITPITFTLIDRGWGTFNRIYFKPPKYIYLVIYLCLNLILLLSASGRFPAIDSILYVGEQAPWCERVFNNSPWMGCNYFEPLLFDNLSVLVLVCSITIFISRISSGRQVLYILFSIALYLLMLEEINYLPFSYSSNIALSSVHNSYKIVNLIIDPVILLYFITGTIANIIKKKSQSMINNKNLSSIINFDLLFPHFVHCLGLVIIPNVIFLCFETLHGGKKYYDYYQFMLYIYSLFLALGIPPRKFVPSAGNLSLSKKGLLTLTLTIILCTAAITLKAFNIKNIRFLYESREGIAGHGLITNKRSEAECSQREGEVGVRASWLEKETGVYRIKLAFDERMDRSSSISCRHRLMDSFWEDEYNFIFMVKAESEILSLTINPEGQENDFVTRCKQRIPTQTINIKLKDL